MQQQRPDIRRFIEDKAFPEMKSLLAGLSVYELADLLGELPGEDLAVCFRLLPRDKAAELLAAIDPELWESILTNLSSRRVAVILNEMSPDDRTELLEELPGELAQRLMNSLRGDELQIARTLLAYPEESLGRLMTPEYVAARPDWTIHQVLAHLRRVGPEVETLNVIVVTDREWRYLGTCQLEDVVLAEQSDTVETLMETDFEPLLATEDREMAIEQFKKYDVVALPVVDSQGTLVGIVTFDDVFDVAEEETTEDFQMVTGMEPLEYSYFGTDFKGMLRKRLPWLAMLLAGQLLTTVALIGFHSLSLFVVLVMFMPLINSPAGNAGSQVAGLMIRGMAVEEITVSDWARVLFREIARGLSMGLVLGVLGAVAAGLFARTLDTQGMSPASIGVSVGVAMAIAVTLANLAGAMLPLVFKRMGLDPAVTSGPFLAWLMDVSGILIYFTVASAVFAGLQ